ncbi:MAG TPA: BrnA antitoxin family protein [Rhodopila sp.]|nr:BrnA antitoxin family protein [Rhodopila sp.]
MVKAAKTAKQSTKARAVSGARSRPAKAQPATRTVTETAQSGWATDLVFDVREPKLAVSLRLDADVLRFFRAFGAGYQTRINEVLKAFMHARGGVDPAHRVPPPSRSRHVSPGNGKRAG